MEIIAFEDKYLKEIEDINVSTSTHPDKPLEEKKLSEYLYVDYYALNSKENCFVAIENNEVIGFILSEPDLDRYKDIILNQYMNEAIKLRVDFKDFLLNEVGFYDHLKDEYPAHLHIAIKPGHQHKGVGSALIKHELQHLKDIGSKGVMLLCSKDNVRANNFYDKNGLPIIESNTCNIRGVKL